MIHVRPSSGARPPFPRPVCTFSGKPHVVLEGKSGSQWKTGLASAYPIHFCHEFAKLFKNGKP